MKKNLNFLLVQFYVFTQQEFEFIRQRMFMVLFGKSNWLVCGESNLDLILFRKFMPERLKSGVGVGEKWKTIELRL